MKPFIPHKEELDHILTLEKGQTFVIARPVEHEINEDSENFEYRGFCEDGTVVFYDTHWEEDVWVEHPFGKEGEEFFVQEVWAHGPSNYVLYRADPDMPKRYENSPDWVSAHAMPHWASRRTIRNAGTECKRVWDVMNNEVKQMGVKGVIGFPKPQFEGQWQSRYGDQYPWEGNPWAFLTTMEVR